MDSVEESGSTITAFEESVACPNEAGGIPSESEPNEDRITLAIEDDIPAIDAIIRDNRHAFGFVRQVALRKSIASAELIVAKRTGNVVGFARFHHRQDGITTLHEISVATSFQHQGIGKKLIEHIEYEAIQRGQNSIRLKCPIDLPANGFYSNLGFQRLDVELRKKRALVVWEKPMLKESVMQKESGKL